MSVVSIEKKQHRGAQRIFLTYDYLNNSLLDKAVRAIPDRQYSKTYKQWHLPYTKEAYAHLQSLPCCLHIVYQYATSPNKPDETSPHTDTTETISSKGENDGISSTNEEKAAASSTDHRQTADIHKGRIVTSARAPYEVTINASWLTIRLPYDAEHIRRIKSLRGAWWNTKHRVWMLHPLPENVTAIQEICAPLDDECYDRFYKMASAISDPVVVELYDTPEHPDKFIVKLRGYGVSTEILKTLPDRQYDKTLKRWIIPRSAEMINRVLSYFGSMPSATIKNRLRDKKYLPTKHVDYAQRQAHLLSKYPSEHLDVLKQYTDALIRMRYSWKTIMQYTGSFFRYIKSLVQNAAEMATTYDANHYLSSLAKQKVSESSIHTAVNAIKFYYEKVIFSSNVRLSQIQRPKKSHRLPVILSIQEVDRMMRSSDNLKHTAILYVLYSSGLRLNEMLSLKLADIYWDRNQLFVRGGKGKKDRTVMLSETLKALLTLYFDQYQPKHYLFNGQDGQSAYSARSVQQVVKKAARDTGIQRHVTPHILRHCFATHLMETGTDVRYIQELLGHKDIKTTLIYTHVTNKSLKKIISPLDTLHLENKKRNDTTEL